MRFQYSGVIVVVVFIAVAAGSEHNRGGSKRPSALERYAEIPGAAINIPLPSVRQPNDFSCGAAALMSVCRFYGVGPRKLADFEDALGTDEDIERISKTSWHMPGNWG